MRRPCRSSTTKRARSLASYPNRPDAKALAITGLGMAVADGEPNAEAAKQDALRRCNARTKGQCRLYAVGMDVVWSKEALPMPAPDDLRFEPLEASPGSRRHSDDQSRAAGRIARTHMRAPNHRALALTNGVAWTQGASDKSRSRPVGDRAVRRIFAASLPALVRRWVADDPNSEIPASHPHLPAVGEAELLASTRSASAGSIEARMAGARRGQEWQLARGRSRALGGCRDRERAQILLTGRHRCRLYAIGNFRVRGE